MPRARVAWLCLIRQNREPVGRGGEPDDNGAEMFNSVAVYCGIAALAAVGYYKSPECVPQLGRVVFAVSTADLVGLGQRGERV